MPALAPFYSQIMNFYLMFISVKMPKDVLVHKSYGYVVTGIKKIIVNTENPYVWLFCGLVDMFLHKWTEDGVYICYNSKRVPKCIY